MRSYIKLGEILANAITHGVAAALAIAGAIVLIAVSMRETAWQIAGCSIFAVAMVLVYLCSTLYHSLVRTQARRVFRILDHSAIHLMIAGTYTPFCLVTLHGPLGWTILGIEWGLAITGIVFKSIAVGRFPVLSALVYLFQGWFIVIAMGPLVHSLGIHGVLWLAAGGLAYTLGIIFFALDRVPYFHALWHLFVLAGSAAHYFAILFYVAPVRL